MASSAELVLDEPQQLAFLATPSVVRALVTPGKPGVYMLLRLGTPFYVGRSDTCLQTRLATHPLLPLATHVAWETYSTPLQAFRVESAWFHILNVDGELVNQIHPARPAGEPNGCPFCSTGDCEAWAHFMSPSFGFSAASTVAVDQMATVAKT